MNYPAFDNTKHYAVGEIVSYWGSYWRALRPVDPPFLPMFQSGDVPGESAAWELAPAKAVVGAVTRSPNRPGVPTAARRVSSTLASRKAISTKAAPITRSAVSKLATKAVTKPAPPASAAQKSALSAAGNHAITSGNKLASRRPGVGKKLASAGQRMVQKATAIKGSAVKISKSPFVAIKGLTAAVASAINYMEELASAGDAASMVADVENTILPVIDSLNSLNTTPATALASQGNDLISRCDVVINNFNPDKPNPLTVVQANAIQSDMGDFLNSAAGLGATVPDMVPGAINVSQYSSAGRSGAPLADNDAAPAPPSATAPGAFDPGTASGTGSSSEDSSSSSSADTGDDGGDDSDSGGSEAIKRFRESGGADDPLADEDDGGGGDSSQYANAEAELDQGEDVDDTGDGSDDGSGDAGDDSDLESDDSVAVQNYKNAGIDPFDSDTNVVGLGPSDYHFEWYDILAPHMALQRTLEESQKPVGTATFTSNATQSGPGQVSPDVAKKLASSQAKLANAQKQLNAMKAARNAKQMSDAQALAAQAQQPTADDSSTTPAPSDGDNVMGIDELADITAGLLLGDSLEEADDIFMEQYEHQITDAEPDVERTHGSAHRGASYLQESTYPAHGSSAGTEGGLVDITEKVEVFGKGEHMSKKDKYSHGLDVLGAGVVSKSISKIVPRTLNAKIAAAKANVVPRAGFVAKTTPGGKRITSLVLRTPKAHDSKAIIRNARDAGKRAVSIGTKLQKAIAAGAAKASKKATAVHGAVAHAPMSVAKMKQLADRAVKAGKAVLKVADSHEKLVNGLAAKTKAAIATAKSKYGPSGRKGTQVRGDDDLTVLGTYLGAYCEALGEASADYMDMVVLGDDPSLDPSADPSATDGSADTSAPDLGSPPTTAPPLVPGQDFYPDPNSSGTDDATYSFSGDLPAGVIVYDPNVKPLPWQGIGSLTRFNPSGDNSDGHGESGFQWGGGDPTIMDGWYWWWHGATHGTEYKHENAGNTLTTKDPRTGQDVSYGQGAQSNKDRQQKSLDLNWGPLIGNPSGWTRNLRYDAAGDRFFWFYDTAPDWAKAPIDNKRLNDAILNYKAQVTAAAADAAAQAAADQLSAQQADALSKQQALEDAATARQQDQEEAQAQHEAAVQTIADEQVQASQSKDDERQALADQKASELQEAQDERAAEFAAKLQADQDARDLAMAQQMDALAPQDDGSADQGADDDGSDMSQPAGDDMDQDMPSDMMMDQAQEDDTLQGLHGSARVHHRASKRRG